MRRRPSTLLTAACWTGLLALAILWPSHTRSWFSGLPLDGRLEAVLAGVVLPALWWAHPRFLDRRPVRAAVLLLLLVRIAGSALLTQPGLCARFSTTAPYATNVLTIPIEETSGALRSWDVRADWRAGTPSCTAIVDRPYATASAFPAWFVNITDFSGAPRELTLDVRGYARVGERGRLSIDLDRGMAVSGRIGSEAVRSEHGEPLGAMLDAGVHPIDLHATLTGDRWRFVPAWNGRDAFSAAAFTVAAPGLLDRLFGRLGGLLVTTIVLLLVGAWTVSLALEYRASPALLAWSMAAACVLAAAGATGRFDRLSVLMLLGAVFVPVAAPHRNLRGAFLLVGVPWLALFAARALPQVGHFTVYSNDDWLAYQVAGYRIFMSGFWLEAGSRVFDYQPLYRWMSGLLHLVFGDSSVGEVYWDAICLLLGGLVAFAVVKPIAGFRWAMAAAAATLATFALGTIWYFVGRGLSEAAAAGWGFMAALVLLQVRPGRVALAVAAGVLAILMFYTRLNHLLFAGFLLALLVPIETASRWRDALAACIRINVRAAAAYAATFAAGVALFAARTWWYTGVFSILYGTSLKNNDTGLRLNTIASPDVWARISHSLRALVWMNEPPAFDPRSVLVAVGAVLAVLALVQVPRINRLSFPIAAVTLGACVSSLLAHTHNYPGRMSIHLAPFAIAMTATAGARLFGTAART